MTVIMKSEITRNKRKFLYLTPPPPPPYVARKIYIFDHFSHFALGPIHKALEIT